jgi:hypothetical protein
MQEGSEKECQFMDAVLAVMVTTLKLGVAWWTEGLKRCDGECWVTELWHYQSMMGYQGSKASLGV